MLENAHRKGLEGEGRQSRVERADKILVEPLCFFDLKTDALDGFEFLTGQVYDKADTQVIQPCCRQYIRLEFTGFAERSTVDTTYSLPTASFFLP